MNEGRGDEEKDGMGPKTGKNRKGYGKGKEVMGET
jgi:hypothetical protein